MDPKSNQRYHRLCAFYMDINGPNFYTMMVNLHAAMKKDYEEQMVQLFTSLYNFEACQSWLEHFSGSGKSTVSKNAFMLSLEKYKFTLDGLAEVNLMVAKYSTRIKTQLLGIQQLYMEDFDKVRNLVVSALPNYVADSRVYCDTMVKRLQAKLSSSI